jgi:hypothetical protein
VPDVSGIPALDVLVGLFFLYFLLSIVCSAVQESIAQVFNLRADTLEQGVRNLLGDEGLTERFFRNPRVKALSKPPGVLRRASGPSYIPSRVFALTLLDSLFPPGEDEGRDLFALARARLEEDDVPGRVKTLLRDALEHAGEERDRFRGELERSFDQAMDRVSGWYKRRAQLILFVVALVTVGFMNADTFSIAQRLWKDDALRAAVAAQTASTTSAASQNCAGTSAEDSPQKRAAKCVDDVEQLGLPLGWTSVTSPHGWGILGKIGGLLVTAFALSLGAPFWFDLLGKFMVVRSTVKPTEKSPDEVSKDGGTGGSPVVPDEEKEDK